MSAFFSNLIFRFYLSIGFLLFVFFGSFGAFEYYILLVFFAIMYWLYKIGYALFYNTFLGWFHERLHSVFYIFSYQFFCQNILINIFFSTSILYLMQLVVDVLFKTFINLQQYNTFKTIYKLETFFKIN